MAKDERSSLNPFTGKSHFDIVNDDKFLQESYNQYYQMVERAQLLDNTPDGQIVRNVAIRLIRAVEDYLSKIGRIDYIEDYYDWDVHLIADQTINAFCMPGGKIVMFSGILSIANTEERVAFILGHEMAHALLDHSRTRASVESVKNTAATIGWFGSFALDLMGLGEVGQLTRAAVNVANIGADYFYVKPFGRDHELEADRLGMLIIHWAGYDISGIPAFWQSMSQNAKNDFDFFSTHPSDDKRIANMRALIDEINSEKDFYSVPVIGNSSSKATNSTSSSHSDSASSSNAVEDSSYLSGDSSANPNQSNDGFQPHFCTNCGAELSPEDNFCTNCGHKIEK